MTLALVLNDTLENQSQLSLGDAIEATMFDGTSVSSVFFLNQHNQCNIISPIQGNVKFDFNGNRQDSIVLLQQFRVNSGRLAPYHQCL